MAHTATATAQRSLRERVWPGSRILTCSYSTEPSQPRRRRSQPTISLEDNLAIARLRRQGYTYKSLAERFNRDAHTLRNHCSRNWELMRVLETNSDLIGHGSPNLKGTPFTKAEDGKVLELRRGGMASSGIARVIGRSAESVTARLKSSARQKTSMEAYDRLKARNPTADGRKSREAFTALDAATVVYLRLHCSVSWGDIVKSFPNRTIFVLQNMYSRFWRERWRDVATTDPRNWPGEALEQLLSKEKRTSANDEDDRALQTRASIRNYSSPTFGPSAQSQRTIRHRTSQIHLFHCPPLEMISRRQVGTWARSIPFSKSESDTVTSMRQSGFSDRPIEKRLGRRGQSVRSHRVSKTHQNKGLYAAEEHKTIMDMKDLGFNLPEIAKALPGRSTKKFIAITWIRLT